VVKVKVLSVGAATEPQKLQRRPSISKPKERAGLPLEAVGKNFQRAAGGKMLRP
jgi:hypothetical protein